MGNSSVGIRECAYLGVPVVNIGSRQRGRLRGPNVVDVGYDETRIKSAIADQWAHGRFAPAATYGGGDAGVRIARALAEEELGFVKVIQY